MTEVNGVEIPPGRATGKTFRRILKALLAASEGKKVTFVCRHDADRRHSYSYFRNILMAAGVDITPPRKFFIPFDGLCEYNKNSGTILLVTETEYKRGRFNPSTHDNYHIIRDLD